MNLKTEYFFSKATKTTWSGIYGNRPLDKEDFEKLGEVYAVMRFATEVEEFEIERFAKIIVKAFEQAYFEDLRDFKSTLERLEESCWKMKSKMDLLLSREKEVADIGIDMEMSILVFKKQYTYALTIGESKVYISRDNSLIDITEGLADSSKTGFFKSASFENDSEDIFCLATSKIGLSEDKIEEGVNNLDIDSLKLSKDQEGLAFMIIAEEDLEWAEYKEEEIVEPQEQVTENIHEESAMLEDEDEPQANKKSENFIEIENPKKIQNSELSADLNEEQDFEDEEYEYEEGESLITKATDNGKKLLSFIGLKSTQAKDRFQKYLQDRKNKREEDFEDEDYDGEYEQEEFEDDALAKSGIFHSASNFLNKRFAGVRKYFENNQTTYVHFIKSVGKRLGYFYQNVKRQFDIHIVGSQYDRRLSSKKRIKRNRWIFAVSVLVIGFFIYSQINSAQNSRKEKNAIQEVESSMASLRQDLTNLSNQVAVNQFSTESNKQSIKNSLDSLTKNLDSQLVSLNVNENIKNKETYQQEINSLKLQVQKQLDSLLLISSFTDPQIIADFAAEFQSTNLTDLEYAGGSLFVSDAGRDVIYKTSTDLNTSIEEFIEDIQEPYILVKNVADEVVVYNNNDSSVLGRFNPNEADSYEAYAGLTPPSTGTPREASIYDGNDALYEIRPENNLIYRRDKTSSGYAQGGIPFQASSSSNWRIDDTFGQAIDIETPYEIYLLINGLGIRRHFGGGENNLQVSTFENILSADRESLKKATAMDVSLKYLAVGDSANNRILIFEIQENNEKTLKFLKQIVYRGGSSILSNIEEIQINEASKQLYVLDGSKLLRFDF